MTVGIAFSFLIPLGITHYLLKYILEGKVTRTRHQMPRPEVINWTRFFIRCFISVFLWYGVVYGFVHSFTLRGFFYFGFFMGLAGIMLISLIGIWQFKKWGVILLGAVIGFFLIVFSWIFVKGGVNSLCPSLIFVFGFILIRELWQTVSAHK